jgi:hypothetical protein
MQHCVWTNPAVSIAAGNALRQSAMQELRRFHRVRPAGLVSKTGILFADLKSSPTLCDIVDISAGGACVDVHGSDAVPKKFILNHGGVKKSCVVVWQKGRRVGVAF